MRSGQSAALLNTDPLEAQWSVFSTLNFILSQVGLRVLYE
jgi:hypothetical protein